MEKYKVKVMYIFEGTYTVAAEGREEAEAMVTEDCGLVLGGNIHTTRDDDEVDWNFSCHPDLQILSIRQRGEKSPKLVFEDRIEKLREDVIGAIRQLLHDHSMNAIRFPEEDYDPVWVVWFNKNGDPYECRVTGLRVTDNNLTVIAEEKESGDEVECYSPFELGARNIDWLHEMYDAVWRQLEETTDNT
ncbi:hypothetical protein [Bacteroides fragilis]|uniref:hypothetical protein n=1 Tax=Bacteroides fragilis TaxID=817 RepID=UPI0020309DD0|nr:hypothetical protein [Bacteroides fragilis]MCM0221183.1 hypothetical protein [Bacteroides fragilis]MCM0269347.1 hypothetical protein [Bacteroides fragilis]